MVTAAELTTLQLASDSSVLSVSGVISSQPVVLSLFGV